MIRTLALLLVMLLSSCAAPPSPQIEAVAQRQSLGGVLTADTVLDGAYLLEADLQVPVGITLTILPGSDILVVASDSTKIDPEYLSKEIEVLIRGRLLAQGTAARPIRFALDSTDNSDSLWAGLQFVASEGSLLEHLRIEQAETGVLCLDSSPQLNYVSILRSRYGILLQQNSQPLISDSQLLDGEAGLFCWDQSAPLLQRTEISGNREEGIYLGRECAASLRQNLIKKNDRGIVLPEGVAVDSSNLIFDNRQNLQTYPSEVTE
ncbi:MAG TPA: NosD domain-containing protein [Malonomonas sp.]